MKRQFISITVTAAALVASSVVASAESCERILWPTPWMVPEASPGATSEIADGIIKVRVGEERAAWPGVFFSLPDERRDLGAYARIDALLTNLTDRVIQVTLSVKSDGGGQRNRSIRLAPWGGGTIRAHIDPVERLDREVPLPGLRHVPDVVGTPKLFDAARMTGCHVFMASPMEPQEFGVIAIAARGTAELREPLQAGDLLPLVDRYGQLRIRDWRGKVNSAADLESAREDEAKWLAANTDPFPDRDKWGGWKDGPKLEATGAFRTAKVDGKWWLVDPDGNLFWSHGIDCVGDLFGLTRLEGRESLFPPFKAPLNSPFKDCEAFLRGLGADSGRTYEAWNFARANIRRKYIRAWDGDWKYPELAHARLRAWGLNTVGNWSHADVCLARRTPYTVDCTPPFALLSGGVGDIWIPDPFAPDFDQKLADAIGVLREAGIADDPWCIGLFVNNEMGWGNDDKALGRAVVRAPADQPAKREMLRRLMSKYDSIGELNAVWGTDYASWDMALESTALPDEANAAEDFRECHRILAEEYFRRVAAIVHREAPGRLYLGCRFASGGEAAFRAAAKYCDVLSVNIYMPLPVPRHGHEPGFPECPMMVGEFHFHGRGAASFATFAAMTPPERRLAYREYVGHALRDPRFVGTHWFQWGDQIVTGRNDGENFPCGFVDICDRPHEELVKAARDVAVEMYPLRYYGKGR